MSEYYQPETFEEAAAALFYESEHRLPASFVREVRAVFVAMLDELDVGERTTEGSFNTLTQALRQVEAIDTRYEGVMQIEEHREIAGFLDEVCLEYDLDLDELFDAFPWLGAL